MEGEGEEEEREEEEGEGEEERERERGGGKGGSRGRKREREKDSCHSLGLISGGGQLLFQVGELVLLHGGNDGLRQRLGVLLMNNRLIGHVIEGGEGRDNKLVYAPTSHDLSVLPKLFLNS